MLSVFATYILLILVFSVFRVFGIEEIFVEISENYSSLLAVIIWTDITTIFPISFHFSRVMVLILT